MSLLGLVGVMGIVAGMWTSQAHGATALQLRRTPNLEIIRKFIREGIPGPADGNLNPPPSTGGALLRVATWNLKRLGQGTKRLDLVAQVMEGQFDVVAINEVMNPDGVRNLAVLLPGWRYELSSRAMGSSSYIEYYAVFYRASQVSLLSSYVVPDSQNRWEREPMVACLASGKLQFCLVMAHVVYGSTVGPRDLEIQALADLVNQLRQAGREKDFIALGDFNRAGTVASFNSFRSEGFTVTNAGDIKTTLGANAYANPYDHVMIDQNFTRQYTGHAGKYDIVANTCAGQFAWCSDQVSDHAPYGFVLDTRMDDYY